MSKIEKELQGATEVTPKRGEERPDYLCRLMKALAGLPEKEWDALSADAQGWYNTNAKARNDAKKADKDIPDPTDFEPEEEQPRRRARDQDEDKPRTKEEAPSLEKLEEHQRIKIVTKRGKVIEGTVVENNPKKEFLVYKDKEGTEDEIDYAKVESLEVFHGDAGRGNRDEPDAGASEPAVGDKVKVTTKRGKVIEGVLTELTDDELVLKTDDGTDDFARDRIENIEVLAKGKKPKGDDDQPRGRKDDDKPKGKEKEKEEPKDEGKRTRSTNPEGVSVGQRIKELIGEDLEITKEDIGKKLKKEGIEFRENTLNLNFAECHKFIAVLREAKRLK